MTDWLRPGIPGATVITLLAMICCVLALWMATYEYRRGTEALRFDGYRAMAIGTGAVGVTALLLVINPDWIDVTRAPFIWIIPLLFGHLFFLLARVRATRGNHPFFDDCHRKE